MKRKDLPLNIKSPITGDDLYLTDIDSLSIAEFFDGCTEWIDDCVMYKNDNTNEVIYVSVERNN